MKCEVISDTCLFLGSLNYVVFNRTQLLKSLGLKNKITLMKKKKSSPTQMLNKLHRVCNKNNSPQLLYPTPPHKYEMGYP